MKLKKYWDVVLFVLLVVIGAVFYIGIFGLLAIIVGIYSALKHIVVRGCDVFPWTCIFKKLP